ncbi:MAG TPA: tetratricopeptide repeat protein [Pirellulales bacterium]|jgi:tetratricopeptide (TPR) repeat protein|nr:tetratricopeptide repeat protein [Pirellulales bacterium]
MTTAGQTPGQTAELEALLALARREHRAGRLAETAEACHRILALRPDLAEVHNDLGIILARQGDLGQAGARFEQAITVSPGYTQAHINLGNVLLGQGRLDEAIARYEHALAQRPDDAQAHYNLAGALKQQGKLERARAHYQRAIALRPDHAEAHNNLGNVLVSQGLLDQAAAHFVQALTLRPNYAEAHLNLGNVLLGQRKLDEAAARYESALALRPDLAEAAYNLGNVLLKQGRLDEATARYQQALALRPQYSDAHYNLGFILREQGRLDEAAARYERALELRPDLADAQLGLAGRYLAEGDYERGWALYEQRARIPGVVRLPNVPRWNGEPLAGRSLLLVAEQGMGDTLLILRYARLLKERGARVVLAAHAALGRLLAAHPDLDEVLALRPVEELPRCDFCLSLMSAPSAFGTTVDTIPRDVPYLWADPELIENWRRELAAIEGMKIGIVWQGSLDYPSDRWRSAPLAQFEPLARVPGVRLISLQKGFGAEQLAGVDFPVLDLASRLDQGAGSFMDTAAVIRNLDLVATVDTAIAHVAGALGAPVWVALPFSPYWIWLRERDDSPWYPTARLFRQTALGEWPSVFEQMAGALRAITSKSA